MPQSLVKNYLHIIFSTKNRYPLICEDIQDKLFSYMAGTCVNLECNPIKVGGYLNHVHILCLLSKKITLIKLLEEVKSHSSKWMKTQGQQFQKFYWQSGYGAFSVNPSEINVVKDYIANQKVHHKEKTFTQEYLAFLKKYDVPYDERYVWD